LKFTCEFAVPIGVLHVSLDSDIQVAGVLELPKEHSQVNEALRKFSPFTVIVCPPISNPSDGTMLNIAICIIKN
jgi:hypothetical protein